VYADVTRLKKTAYTYPLKVSFHNARIKRAKIILIYRAIIFIVYIYFDDKTDVTCRF